MVRPYKDISAKIGWWLCRLGKCVLAEWSSGCCDIADILADATSHGNSVVAVLELGRGTFDRYQTG